VLDQVHTGVNSDIHLDSKNRYIVHINPQAAGYLQTQVEPLYRTIEAQFHALPGVVKVGIATYTGGCGGNCRADTGTSRGVD
jgi:hypothetical protein